ncbi:hypothetical protein LOD99_2542 [Oopsacas minuta]|uniref:Uncharacterized protein n=1 Tax=Oopsacas minuta TaxID=111878 RepID=A0AAV7K3G8_9METZ|nr:hypothetical protein LOD99_2542 [Oopsacas minuta]
MLQYVFMPNVVIQNCGRDVNIPDTSGWSPLHLACHDGTSESVQLLISSKYCDVNLLDLHSASPLHNCVFANRPDLIKKLIEAGANPNCQDKSKRAPLHYAIERGYTECAHMLQKSNTPLKGKTLLHNLRNL